MVFPRIFVVALVCAVAAVGCDFRAAPAGDAVVGSPWCEGKVLFEDDFEDGLSPGRWSHDGEGRWAVVDGWLQGQRGNENHALWLAAPLPSNVRVEFDVRGGSDDGDIKVEIFGDGARHASGYILIFGGWKNSLNAIARLDEHGKDRKAGRGEKVVRGRTYEMAVVRSGGVVSWYSDRGARRLLMSYEDGAPLVGEGHDRFAFNNWDVPVYFDNIRVIDLEGCK
jgi:hypothetical protein